MSGMDERARQFKTAAESQLSGPALKKEIGTLRRFLFRNQEYRFTKSAQQALYMAVLAHYGNSAAHRASGLPASTAGNTAAASASGAGGPPFSTLSLGSGSGNAAAPQQLDSDEGGREDDEAAAAPILGLLDDALKMPFTVFTSPQKDKLLSLYWAVLGVEGPQSGSSNTNTATAGEVATLRLSLMDVVDIGKHMATLSLFAEDGEEYAQEVLVDDADTLNKLKKDFNEGNAVRVMVQETNTGARFLSYSIEED
ncbi:hypothetical protein ABL78_1382 [Leptomonas seymouri]|uniref:Uncharacterized protein n=1 Tax=Leptomonas seymouri TaxID=5684 RepID=A0A0N0P841_LEPSE|nr:hypothetical protein ABL78_1382 [Leptomonas seymouri]|eukprot:KPI89506.1 hypothetical protein ABL78_1382 [Leptomonas seymouri]